jgi:hypothetical protein
VSSLHFGVDGWVFTEDSCQSAAQLLERGTNIPLCEIQVVNEARVVDVDMARLDTHIARRAHIAYGRAKWIV